MVLYFWFLIIYMHILMTDNILYYGQNSCLTQPPVYFFIKYFSGSAKRQRSPYPMSPGYLLETKNPYLHAVHGRHTAKVPVTKTEKATPLQAQPFSTTNQS
jgi:hypothetical protein